MAAEIANDRASWGHLFRSDDALPIYLNHPTEVFVCERLASADGVYIQLKLNDDYHTQSIRDFLDGALNEAEEIKPHFIVVDLRGNTGGDFTKTTTAFSRLPTVLPLGGWVYVITDGGTFSAAITDVNVLKQVGGRKTAIVGQPLGDSQ